MSRRSPTPIAIGTALVLVAVCFRTGQANARCAAFNVAALPFYTCINEGSGGFWVSAGAQTAIIAGRIEGRGGPLFALSLDYREGVRVGPWIPTADFAVTFRRDGAGPGRNKLAARFCASSPLSVTTYGGDSKLASCGDWVTLIEDPQRPSEDAMAFR